jgi:subfamily B ATP-binding cassette protein MsbA
MKDFIQLLFRLVPPYKRKVFLNVLNNLLSTIFSLFSFAMIVPILEMLFKTNRTAVVTIKSLSFTDIGQWGSALKNNFYYFINNIITDYGGGTTLLILGSFLVAMTAFKVSFMYMAARNMVTIRTGVLRDLRNAIFNKIIALPLAKWKTPS